MSARPEPIVARVLLAPFRAWDRFFFAEVDPRPLALLRILTGALSFLTFVGLARTATFFHSDAGWLPLERVATFPPGARQWWTPLHAVTSPEGVHAFALAAMAAALLMMVGYRSRLASWLVFLALVSFVHRDALINYGGDSTIRLLVFGVALGPSGRVWSVDAVLRRYRLAGRASDRGEASPRRLRRLAARGERIAAWPIRLLQIQVGLIYFMSGWAKLHGATWWNGEALPLALLNPQISRFDFARVGGLPGVEPLTRIVVAATMWWEVLFAALVLFKWGRVLALAIGTGVHLGIWALMRVHWFAPIMIASYVAFVPGRALRAAGLAVRRRLRRRARARRVRLIYDEGCAVCRRRVLFLLLCDPFRALEPVAASDVRRFRRHAPRLAAEDARRAIWAVARGKEPVAGFEALRAAAWAVPLLAPLALLAWLPGFVDLGRAIHGEIDRGHARAAAAPAKALAADASEEPARRS